jgi:hypothetical protein
LHWRWKTASGRTPQLKGNDLVLFFKGMGV